MGKTGTGFILWYRRSASVQNRPKVMFWIIRPIITILSDYFNDSASCKADIPEPPLCTMKENISPRTKAMHLIGTH
jgi:hypothetical protein